MTYAKSRLVWLYTRRRVDSDIERLTDTWAALYDEEGFGDTVEPLFRDCIGLIMNALDESLADKLAEAINTPEPAHRRALAKEAPGIIARDQAHLASEPLIAKLDSNPLMPLWITATISA